MGVNTRRCLRAVGVGVVLVISSATPSAGAQPKFGPAPAARTCARSRTLDSRFGAEDARFLARFLPCVLRHYRSEAGFSYLQSQTLSHRLAGALERLVKLSYLSEGRVEEANAVGLAAAGAVARKFCKSRGWSSALLQFLWIDTSPPPTPTPLEFATLLREWFKSKDGVARTPPALFGIATTRGLLFRGDDLAGAASGAIDVFCV